LVINQEIIAILKEEVTDLAVKNSRRSAPTYEISSAAKLKTLIGYQSRYYRHTQRRSYRFSRQEQ
jgi:hypothetical protein